MIDWKPREGDDTYLTQIVARDMLRQGTRARLYKDTPTHPCVCVCACVYHVFACVCLWTMEGRRGVQKREGIHRRQVYTAVPKTASNERVLHPP